MELPGSATSGRHRKLSETASNVPLRVATAFIVIGLATAAGVASFRGPIHRSVISAPTSLQEARDSPTNRDSAKNVSNAGSASASAYLDALRQQDVNVTDSTTLLLVADSVCARRGEADAPAQAQRLISAFPGRWTPQQAAVIVDNAITFVCRDAASHGTSVSAGIFPAK